MPRGGTFGEKKEQLVLEGALVVVVGRRHFSTRPGAALTHVGTLHANNNIFVTFVQ